MEGKLKKRTKIYVTMWGQFGDFFPNMSNTLKIHHTHLHLTSSEADTTAAN